MVSIKVHVASDSHFHFAEFISQAYKESAKQRGTGIAERSAEYIRHKMEEKKAVIATTPEGDFCGFCYIETWQHDKYIVNSGLIVLEKFRHLGVARKIKEFIFQYSRKRFPKAKIFGLTTSLAVMRINSDLGYYPVTFSELPQDELFWKGCTSCVNYSILKSKDFQNCLCTGMLHDPHRKKTKKWDFVKKFDVLERWHRIKNRLLKRKPIHQS